jgi:hypothetical protein
VRVGIGMNTDPTRECISQIEAKALRELKAFERDPKAAGLR